MEKENDHKQRTIKEIIFSAAEELEGQGNIKEFEERQEAKRKAEDRRDLVRERQLRKNRKNEWTFIWQGGSPGLGKRR